MAAPKPPAPLSPPRRAWLMRVLDTDAGARRREADLIDARLATMSPGAADGTFTPAQLGHARGVARRQLAAELFDSPDPEVRRFGTPPPR